MQELTTVNGLVLKTLPSDEYDRRVVILTAERGKISCFAKGARKPNSVFLSSTNPLCYGTFLLYEGRSAYSLNEARISNYFSDLRSDFEGTCYGMYFLELADYYTVENNDEKQMLGLVYQSLRALEKKTIDSRLIKCIVEIKSLVINGEYPGAPEKEDGTSYDESTLYTLSFIEKTPLEKLFTFTVSDKVLSELTWITTVLRNRFFDRPFKSLEILSDL
ncbi:MAG: DNA repair protein RecO [Lachnospiraceae bacterium]|nr:DNA repair protein RecO [Lachnospiraceae bacterium]